MPDKNVNRDSGSLSVKNAARATLVLLGILIVGSIFFYKERVLFGDTAHILFRVVNYRKLQITEHRYGSFITQMVPYLLVWLHAPLKLIAILYSASFDVFFIVVALLLIYRYKNYQLAVLLGFYLVLFASDTFYWPTNELHQGVAWLFLAVAVNFSGAAARRPLIPGALLFACTFFLAIWTHPLVIIIAAYLLVFFRIGKINWPLSSLQTAVVAPLFFLLAFLKLHQGASSWYDSAKINTVSHIRSSQILATFSGRQFHFFVKECLVNYWAAVLLLAVGVVFMIREKRYAHALWTVSYAFFYCLLVWITFAALGNMKFYIESEYMPLGIICAAPFVYFILPRLSPKTATVIVALVFAVRLVYIYDARQAFSSRVDTLTHVIQEMKKKRLSKAIIPEPIANVDDTLIMGWGAPEESLLLSGINGGHPMRTFLLLNDDQLRSFHTDARDTLLESFSKSAASTMNQGYFELDTNSTYTFITYDQLMN